MGSGRRSTAQRSTRPPAEPDLHHQLDVAGWMAIPDVIDGEHARRLAERCERLLGQESGDVRVGDKPGRGTHRLVDLLERMPEIAGAFDHRALRSAVHHLLGDGARLAGVTFRSPQPGFGEQRMHADDVPLLTPGPWRVVTAILGLCPFTPENGATTVLPGSHRRPDLQRLSGSLERHGDQIVLAGPAGTAFVFCGHLLHGGTRNRSPAPRPALQASWRS